MTPYNPKQNYLIAPEAVFGLQPLRKYELLFETLEPCLAGCFPSKTRGTTPLKAGAPECADLQERKTAANFVRPGHNPG